MLEEWKHFGAAQLVAITQICIQGQDEAPDQGNVLAMRIGQAEKLEIAARRRYLRSEGSDAPLGGEGRPVTRVVGIARGQQKIVEPIAVLSLEELRQQGVPRDEPGISVTDSNPRAAGVRDRQTKAHAGDTDIREVVDAVQFLEFRLSIGEIESPADAVYRIIRVGIGEAVIAVGAAVVKDEGDPFAGPQKVVLGNAGVENDALGLGVADTGE